MLVTAFREVPISTTRSGVASCSPGPSLACHLLPMTSEPRGSFLNGYASNDYVSSYIKSSVLHLSMEV